MGLGDCVAGSTHRQTIRPGILPKPCPAGIIDARDTAGDAGEAYLVAGAGAHPIERAALATLLVEFACDRMVGSNEEVILIVGVATADERANRLRVQVRDGQGGSNQDVQARWKVTIEAAE